MVSRILYLIKYEALLEFRNKALTGSLFVYVISTVFVCYQSFHSTSDTNVWSALFWIIILFSSTNAVFKSFQRENKGSALYIYQTVKAEEIILAKIFFNYILTLLLIIGTIPIFLLLMGNPIKDSLSFFFIAFLTAGAFSACLTLISGIAAKTNNSAGLTSVLGFPVIIPVIIVAVKASEYAAIGNSISEYWDLLLVLFSFNVVVIILSFLLFPYLWRD